MYTLIIKYTAGFLNKYPFELKKQFETKKAAKAFADDFRANHSKSNWHTFSITEIKINKNM